MAIARAIAIVAISIVEIASLPGQSTALTATPSPIIKPIATVTALTTVIPQPSRITVIALAIAPRLFALSCMSLA